MAKTTKFILGSVVIVAAIGVGLHYMAPVYTEKNLRSALTDPQSQIRGEFSNFHMSLFKGTMSADDVKIISMDGTVYQAGRVDISGIDWLAVYGFNPLGDALAAKMQLANARIDSNGRIISFDTADLADVSADTSTWLPETFAAGDIKSPGLKHTFLGQSSNIADIHIEDIAFDHIGGVTTGAWNYDAGSEFGNASVAQSIFANCAGPMKLLQQTDTADFNWNSAESCEHMALADLAMSLPDKSKLTAAGILIDGLDNESFKKASVTGLKIVAPQNRGKFEIGRLEISDFDQAIDPDQIPMPGEKFDFNRWLKAFETVKIGKLELSDQFFSTPDAEIRWDHFSIHNLGDQMVGEISSRGLSLHGSDTNITAKFGLDTLTLRDVNLKSIASTLEYISPTADEAEQLALLSTRTLGEMGFPFSVPYFSTYEFSGLEVGISGVQDVHLTVDEFGGAIGDVGPIVDGGADVARTQTGHIAGVSIDMPDEVANNPRVLDALGVKKFSQLTLDMDAHQRWSAKTGDFQYAIDELTVRDFGTVKFSMTLSGFSPEVVDQLQSIPVMRADRQLPVILGQNGALKSASLEIYGDNLVPTALRLMALKTGVPSDQLQLTAGMSIMQAQQQYGSTGQLGTSLQQLANWIAKPQHLKITLTPENPVPFADLMNNPVPPTPPVLAETFGLKILANDEVANPAN
ncbi:hypothetical protein TH25_20205 [Thalassospira profundimaris]|uniref:Uncharacterized protein n=1 Tax=Thalassospira profundimaris TaxID=502049 RepID=A0A367WRP9_9PROT|nr:hypothetical protein [Thalassospira profundimaris]RCK44068.1 hypothetical protein TH25_20205 [Thalassospira profundimaris]